MNRKLYLVALALSIIAFLICLTILVAGFYYGDTQSDLLLLVLTGFSLALIGVNLSGFRRYRKD